MGLPLLYVPKVSLLNFLIFWFVCDHPAETFEECGLAKTVLALFFFL